MYKELELVMLPTNEKANSLKGYTDKNLLFNFQKEYKTIEAEKGFTNHFHLYFLSDEEIKEGDYGYNAISKTIDKFTKSLLQNKQYYKKIIATTDNFLEIVSKGINPVYEKLPQPSQDFIKYYIEQYNLGNVITKVLVEYEPKRWVKNPNISKEQDILDTEQIKSAEDYDKYLDYGLKVNSNNEISIKPIKDSWNRQVHGNTLEYWKQNAEEDYIKVPISVLKYITCLEEIIKDSYNKKEI